MGIPGSGPSSVRKNACEMGDIALSGQQTDYKSAVAVNIVGNSWQTRMSSKEAVIQAGGSGKHYSYT